MTEIGPRLKDLIMDTTAEVLRETGLHKVRFEDLTTEQVNMLCERMGFEIKARMMELFNGLDAGSLKAHFDVIDESVDELKKRLERETKGECKGASAYRYWLTSKWTM